jgi:membrane-bound lytic murein transglycosylase B
VEIFYFTIKGLLRRIKDSGRSESRESSSYGNHSEVQNTKPQASSHENNEKVLSELLKSVRKLQIDIVELKKNQARNQKDLKSYESLETIKI